VTHLQRAQSIVAEYDALVREELPGDVLLFDAHTHLGDDIDGMQGRPEQLTEILDRYGFSRANVFCLDEPDREPAFTAANDRTLTCAACSDGRFVPFARLDLAQSPLEEAERCLDRGARGIKLHPRAQRFSVGDDRLAPIFSLAAERQVPILIHGGRGLPPIAEHLEKLVRSCAGVRLIVAHAGIADMAGLAGRLGGVSGVYFDTSVWSAIDLLDLYRQVSPEQIVYASDYPYGRQPNSLLASVRTARIAGFDDRQLRLMLGESARRIADNESPEPLSSPRGTANLVQPLTFARIHHYLSMAVPMLWLRQRDGVGALGLALNAAQERNGHEENSERVLELLSTASDLWREGSELSGDEQRTRSYRAAIQLVHLADLITVTVSA
jgi:predicted TIM-barrel fold metal-dependent hydrolase